jgi:hypothetical protein
MSLLFIPQVIYEHGEPWWNDTDKGQQKNTEKNLSKCHFFHQTFHPNANPDLRGERPGTNRLSHGTAQSSGCIERRIFY